MTWKRRLLHAIDPAQWAQDELGFTAEPWQRDVLRSRATRLALNCARQAGKSTVAAIGATHTAVHKPGSVSMVASPSLRQSSEVARKVRGYLAQLGVEPTENNASELMLPNGSRTIIAPASGDDATTARGFALDLLIIDECARVSDGAIASVRPMLAARPNARLIYLSTTRGQRGDFYRACTDGSLNFEVHTVRAHQIAHITPEFLASELAALGPRVFASEYQCEFGETEAAMFDHATLRACLDSTVAPLFSGQSSRLDGLLSGTVYPLPI